MSTINVMRQFIAKQAETMHIVRNAEYADSITLAPMFGTPEDGNFDSEGKFDGKGELMMLDDLNMIDDLYSAEGMFIPYPFRIADKGVYLYDTNEKEYKKICNDELWIQLNPQEQTV